MVTPIYSLSLSAQAILDMHSLNNEGGEGNQIQTRMVNIVDVAGKLHNVNAISGDMLKHIQAEHLFRIASGSLPLCAGCRKFNANRISADPAYETYVTDPNNSYANSTDRLLQTCAIDDLEGNLITSGKQSLPRKSVVEFGWIVALPESSSTDSYFHVKYANERGESRRAADSAEGARGANLGQAIFHRPASSGIYAIVGTMEMARIGFNDIAQTYAIDDAQRLSRYKALMESLLYTFVQMNGAMRNTQHPHLVDFMGVLGVSSQVMPAPTLSPLNPAYEEQLTMVAASLNRIRPSAISLRHFASLAEFSAIMAELLESTAPYRLTYSQ